MFHLKTKGEKKLPVTSIITFYMCLFFFSCERIKKKIACISDVLFQKDSYVVEVLCSVLHV